MSLALGNGESFSGTEGFLRERGPDAESLVARLVILVPFAPGSLGDSDDK